MNCLDCQHIRKAVWGERFCRHPAVVAEVSYRWVGLTPSYSGGGSPDWCPRRGANEEQREEDNPLFSS